MRGTLKGAVGRPWRGRPVRARRFAQPASALLLSLNVQRLLSIKYEDLTHLSRIIVLS